MEDDVPLDDDFEQMDSTTDEDDDDDEIDEPKVCLIMMIDI